MFGVLVSAGILYWVLRGTSFPAILAAVRHASLTYFLLSTLFVTLTFPARAFRSRWLLRAATGERPPYVPVWRATAVGFMANNVLPLRAGEVARGYMMARLLRLPLSLTLSTIGVERVFDGIVMMLLLAIGVGSPEFPGAGTAQGARLASIAGATAALFVVALVVLVFVAHWPQRFLAPVHALARRTLSERAAARALAIIDGLVGGLSVLRRGSDFAWVLAWTLGVWGLNCISYVLAFRAFHLDIPASASLVLQGVVVIGVAVPSTPGWFGVFEGACVLTLGFYAVGRSLATAFALAVHLAWFIPITILGVWALARAGVTMHDIRSPERA